MSLLIGMLALLVTILNMWTLYEVSKHINTLRNRIEELENASTRSTGTTATSTGSSSTDPTWVVWLRGGKEDSVTAATEGEALRKFMARGVRPDRILKLERI
jgi:hypothetical protein